jgi:hypothetical protein
VHEISANRFTSGIDNSTCCLSAILRMLLQLDQDEKTDLRHALDTPRPDEDVYLASDRWISTLADQEQRAHTILALVEEIIQKHTSGHW